jgi:hypothetical protein
MPILEDENACVHGKPYDADDNFLSCWRCWVYTFRHYGGWKEFMLFSVDERGSRPYRSVYFFWAKTCVMFWDDGAIHVEHYGKRPFYKRFRESDDA